MIKTCKTKENLSYRKIVPKPRTETGICIFGNGFPSTVYWKHKGVRVRARANPENGGSKVPRNVGTLPQHYTAS